MVALEVLFQMIRIRWELVQTFNQVVVQTGSDWRTLQTPSPLDVNEFDPLASQPASQPWGTLASD